MAKVKKKTDTKIELERLVEGILDIPIVGLTPVIPHRWSEKAKRSMPGHPDKDKVKKTKELRNPEQEADACLYKMGKKNEKIGMPATAFKAATVGACRFFDEPSIVQCKQLVFVQGEGPEQLVEISGTKELREDMPRNSGGNCDLRYRYYIHDWKATLRIRFVPALISPDSICALVDAAGRGGVGDWRPSSPKSQTGTFGTFRVDDDREVKVVKVKA